MLHCTTVLLSFVLATSAVPSPTHDYNGCAASNSKSSSDTPSCGDLAPEVPLDDDSTAFLQIQNAKKMAIDSKAETKIEPYKVVPPGGHGYKFAERWYKFDFVPDGSDFGVMRYPEWLEDPKRGGRWYQVAVVKPGSPAGLAGVRAGMILHSAQDAGRHRFGYTLEDLDDFSKGCCGAYTVRFREVCPDIDGPWLVLRSSRAPDVNPFHDTVTIHQDGCQFAAVQGVDRLAGFMAWDHVEVWFNNSFFQGRADANEKSFMTSGWKRGPRMPSQGKSCMSVKSPSCDTCSQYYATTTKEWCVYATTTKWGKPKCVSKSYVEKESRRAPGRTAAEDCFKATLDNLSMIDPATRPREANLVVSAQLTADQKTGILAKHNELRAAIADPCTATDMETLVWDDTLATQSQTYADACVGDHDSRAAIDFGENLWMLPSSSTYTTSDLTTAVQEWYDEIKDVEWKEAGGEYTEAKSKAGTAGCAWPDAANGNCFIGHFTQVVWAKSNKIGCGVKACSPMTVSGQQYANGALLVCRYTPAGNSAAAPNSPNHVKMPFIAGSKCANCAGACSTAGLCNTGSTPTRCGDKPGPLLLNGASHADCTAYVGAVSAMLSLSGLAACTNAGVDSLITGTCDATCSKCTVATGVGKASCGAGASAGGGVQEGNGSNGAHVNES